MSPKSFLFVLQITSRATRLTVRTAVSDAEIARQSTGLVVAAASIVPTRRVKLLRGAPTTSVVAVPSGPGRLPTPIGVQERPGPTIRRAA